MATLSMTRMPFGELSSSRVQALASKKNSQNAITETLGKNIKEKLPVLTSPSKKRSYTPEPFQDDFDEENMVPSHFSPKRSKAFDGTYRKPVVATSSILSASISVPGLKQASALTASTAAQSSKSLAPDFVLPGGANTAPIGRSPKSKRPGVAGRKPWYRVNPPTFDNSSSMLPFSIEEALAGTLNRPVPKPSKPSKPVKITKGLKFAIWEDTPDQEAQNLMEHCAGILEISDDEAKAHKKVDKGKENVAPADYVVPSVAQTKSTRKPRRSVHEDAMVDVGEERAPLGALPTEDFYGNGLNAGSITVILEEDETASVPESSVSNVEERVTSLLAAISTPLAPGVAEAGFTIACDDDVNDY